MARTEISLTAEQLVKKAPQKLLLEFFKKCIVHEYGPHYSVSMKEGMLIATPETDPQVATLEELLSSEDARKELPLNAFVATHLPNYETGTETSRVSSRMKNSLNYASSVYKMSLEELLNSTPKKIRGFRNFGDVCYVLLCEDFEKLGFDVRKFAAFKDYERVKANVNK